MLNAFDKQFARAQWATSAYNFKKKINRVWNLFTAQCKKSRLDTLNCLINSLTDKNMYLFEEILVSNFENMYLFQEIWYQILKIYTYFEKFSYQNFKICTYFKKFGIKF